MLRDIGLLYTIEIKVQGLLGITAYDNKVPLLNIHELLIVAVNFSTGNHYASCHAYEYSCSQL